MKRMPRAAWVAMAAGAVVLLSVVGFILLRRRAPADDVAAGPGVGSTDGWAQPLHTPAFTGDSAKLERTVIVPTLDTPMPPGKNVIWCSSFQVAWNRLKDDVIKEPIKVRNAQAVADRLNNAPQSEADLDPESFYAAAGITPEVIARIQREMATRFPNVPKPEFDVAPGWAVAYAYLAAGAKFTIPFFENDERFEFEDSSGRKTAVTSFGLRGKDTYAYEELHRQVAVLYCKMEGPGPLSQFVVDPCRTSNPNQVILACIPAKASLSEMLSDLAGKIGAESRSDDNRLGLEETLLVPNLVFDVTHRFRELEGPELVLAFQMVRFRLDRSGAELASEARLVCPAVPRHLLFDRPFLIVMRKRGAQHPFFVMWVDNAELLCKP
jgi:hypothetical protein